MCLYFFKRKICIDDFEMAPFQTTVNIRQESIENLGQDIIDLHILPGEENWAENTTAITGNTSERSESVDGVSQWPKYDETFNVACSRYLGSSFAVIIIGCAFLSPLIMILLPKFGFIPDALSILTIQQRLTYASCNIECKGQLLGLGFKVTLLGIGCWAIFIKRREALMPRLYMFRSGVIILTTLCVCTFWLFYIVQVQRYYKNKNY
jgi:vang-like